MPRQSKPSICLFAIHLFADCSIRIAAILQATRTPDPSTIAATNCNRFSCRRIRMRQRQGNERNRRKPPPRRMRQKKKALQLRESSRKSSPSPSQFRSGRNAFVRGDEPFRSCVLLDSRSRKCMSCAKVTSCVPHLSRNQPAEFAKGLSSADNSTKKVSAYAK